jgi:hypothetical protein
MKNPDIRSESRGSLTSIAVLPVLLAIAVGSATSVRAEGTAGSSPAAFGSDYYGPFGWLDHRSSYGQGDFPEPFLVDDSDLEVNEARLDWLHTSAAGQRTDLTTAEVEKGFGLLTLEIEVPYERDTNSGVDPATGRPVTSVVQGMSNVDLGARAPLFQFVSHDGFLDTTVGTAVEVGVPTNSPVSRNAEVVPKLFDDLKLGENFTLQSIFGYSMLYGSGDEGGVHTFEYGFVFGYTLREKQLPLPHVLSLIPVFELSGATQENKDESGHDTLLGNLGFRLNLKAIGPAEPRLGFGYVFPVDKGGREAVHQGFVTSLVVEY